MLESTIEFVAQATGSSHFIFCFCNVIIVLLLIDRFRSDLDRGFTNSYPFPVALDSNVTQTYYGNYVVPAAAKADVSVRFTPEVASAAEIAAAAKEDFSVRFTSEVAAAETVAPNVECEDDSERKDEDTKEEEEDSVQSTSETVAIESSPAAAGEDDNGREDENQEEGHNTEVEDDSDELRIRIEQFIDKINREWRAEKLRTTGKFD